MEGEALIYLQLHKLSTIKSQEDLQHILSTLWNTRKTGLSAPDKSSLRSLLNLPSSAELDPVISLSLSLSLFKQFLFYLFIFQFCEFWF
ncbi:hypothetical protein CsSME_00046115 [Camellia sinensis var. sinensis]